MTILELIRKFHKFKPPTDLDLVERHQIVVPENSSRDDCFKCFIGYKEGEIVKPLCIILSEMSGYMKYFKNGGKNVSFMIKNDMCMDKYNDIRGKIKERLNIKFHSMPVYDEKHIKAKVGEFVSVIKTKFLGDKVPKENMHYTCIACITTDSVMRMEKKNYPQVYLEECKYRVKKAKMTKFIEAELESGSESELESELESESKPDTE